MNDARVDQQRVAAITLGTKAELGCTYEFYERPQRIMTNCNSWVLFFATIPSLRLKTLTDK